MEDQDFWTELTKLTKEGTLRLIWSWELMCKMRCLVEVSKKDALVCIEIICRGQKRM